MKQILGVGNALVDALVAVEDGALLHRLNLAAGGMTLIDHSTFLNLHQCLNGRPIKKSTGGSAANALLAAAALGAPSAFVGKTGIDENGRFYTATRAQQGVVAHELHHKELPTGTCTSFILPDGQRTMATYLGASATLSAEDLRAEWFDGVGFVFVEGYLVQDHALIEQVFALSHKHGALVCLDLAAWNIVELEHAFLSQLLAKTDIVFANEEEAAALLQTPLHDLCGEKAARALSARCGGIAIVKCGSRGAWAASPEGQAYVEAVPVPQVLDTTAAGDFFAGGFLTALAAGASLKQCLRAGATCASEVIQVMGTALPPEAWTRLKQQIQNCTTC